MKKILLTASLMSMLFFAGAALAVDEHHPEKKDAPPATEMKTEQMKMGPMGMDMMKNCPMMMEGMGMGMMGRKGMMGKKGMPMDGRMKMMEGKMKMMEGKMMMMEGKMMMMEEMMKGMKMQQEMKAK